MRHLLSAWMTLTVLVVCPVQARLVDAFPIIVRADNAATITLVFDDEPLLANPADIQCEYVCADGLTAQGDVLEDDKAEVIRCVINGSTVTITTCFRGETEHTLRIIHKSPDLEKPSVLGTARLYSLKPDYFALRPYRGNMHMHSQLSDGDKNETPAFMVATCRTLGQDFAIVTDHNVYAASLSAIEEFSKLPTDMKTFPGEEVHSPGNDVHILSLGASESMNDWFTNQCIEYDKAVADEKARLPSTIPDNLKQPIAASFAVWDKIRSCGGIAVLAHPYWRPSDRQYIPTLVADYLFQTARFDAMEVVNDESTDLSILQYHELRAQGLKIAGIGVTDAHSSRRLESAYTIVLAETLSFPSLAQNIRLRNCAAVDIDPLSKRHTVIGEFRFCRYAIFLIHNFYPKQNEICRQEGEWLTRALTGDAEAVASLRQSQGTTPGLRVKYWQN